MEPTAPHVCAGMCELMAKSRGGISQDPIYSGATERSHVNVASENLRE